MEKAEGKRKAENEDEGVKKQPRLGSEAETSAPEVAVPPPVRQNDPLGVGDNLTSRYIIQRYIGQGGHAVVFECWDSEGWESVAIKVSKSSRDGDAAKYEIALLQQLAKSEQAKSRYVQIRDAFEYENHYCIVFEKLGPSLREFLKINNGSPVPVGLVRILGRQLLEAVVCMHDSQIIHTDLKPQNILLVSSDFAELPVRERCSSDQVHLKYLPKSNAIKLIDFGGSIHDRHRLQAKHLIGVVTTRNYRAPEIVLGLDWSFPCDMWSVGCILAELCTGQALFKLNQELDLEHLALMERVLGHLPKDMIRSTGRETKEDSATGWTLNWPEGASSRDTISLVNSHCPLQEFVSRHVQSSKSSILIDLLNGLLKYDPSERLTAREALEHPFFKNPPEGSHTSPGTSVR